MSGPPIPVSYGRTSTRDQQAGLDAQIRDLKTAGCEAIFLEWVSAVAQGSPKGSPAICPLTTELLAHLGA
jgi:DNA invertase Pin-like site-specific DNA recombinase